MEEQQTADQQREELEQEVAAAEEEALAKEAASETVEMPVGKTPQEERDEWKDKSYRLAAEMENVKKRTAKDVQEARKYAVATFARDLLAVQDNMERALETVKNIDMQEEAQKTIVEGLEMVSNQLCKAFDGAKIQRIETKGEKLNPDLHQAVVEIPTAEAEVGVIVQEIQAGYMIDDRLLRPAMVGTAKKPE